MMKLRTLSELQDALDRETSWRKQEFTYIRFTVDDAKSPALNYALRSGVALLYAHWEGWVKGIACLYLNYINQKKLTYNEITQGLLGGALKTRISELEASNTARKHRDFARFIGTDLDQVAHISEALVRTESNLTSTVLADIMTRLGFPDDVLLLDGAFIDSRLVLRRNSVAHGEHLLVDKDEFLDDLDKTRRMLDRLSDLVSNAAATAAYRRA